MCLLPRATLHSDSEHVGHGFLVQGFDVVLQYLHDMVQQLFCRNNFLKTLLL
jgi:hypothetical protein